MLGGYGGTWGLRIREGIREEKCGMALVVRIKGERVHTKRRTRSEGIGGERLGLAAVVRSIDARRVGGCIFGS